MTETTTTRRGADERDSHTRWNFAVICSEAAAFQAGIVWTDPATVLPVFLGHLSGSTVLVGLVTFLQRLGWIMPQLPMAAVVGHRPRRLPYLRWGVLLGRLPLQLFVLYLWIFGLTHSQVVIPSLLVAFFFVSLGNGFVSLPWQDIIAKSIPVGTRGRFFGVMQFATAAAALAIGFIVRFLLGSGGPGFPTCFFVLFTLTAVFYTLSTIGCWLVREPIRPVLERPESLREICADIPRLVRQQPGLRLIATVALFGNGLALSTCFYTVYATRALGVAPQMVGIYILAATLGAMISSLVSAHCNDRHGPHVPIRGATTALLIAPLLALALPPLGRVLEIALGMRAEIVPYLLSLVFLTAGWSGNGLWIGINNYLYDLCGHEDRPRTLAIANTLATPGALIPVLIGTLLKFCPFSLVFALMAAGGGVIFLCARRLPKA